MRTTLILAGALALGTAAYSQDLTSGHLAAIDGNGDGVVDQSEFEAFIAASFATLDANKDGMLTVEEATVTMTPEQFAAINANKDGGVSRAEFIAQFQKDFAAADKDGNGVLN